MKNAPYRPTGAAQTVTEKPPLCAELMALVERARETTNDRMLRLPEVRKKMGRADSTIWKDSHLGMLPSPIPVGARAVAWRESELQACLDAMTFASRTKQKIDMRSFVALLTAPIRFA